jgi:hypothetical protein
MTVGATTLGVAEFAKLFSARRGSLGAGDLLILLPALTVGAACVAVGFLRLAKLIWDRTRSRERMASAGPDRPGLL